MFPKYHDASPMLSISLSLIRNLRMLTQNVLSMLRTTSIQAIHHVWGFSPYLDSRKYSRVKDSFLSFRVFPNTPVFILITFSLNLWSHKSIHFLSFQALSLRSSHFAMSFLSFQIIRRIYKTKIANLNFFLFIKCCSVLRNYIEGVNILYFSRTVYDSTEGWNY